MLFTTDAVVLQYSLWYVWIVALSYGAIAVSMIVASSFQAMGKSWPGFWLIFSKFFLLAIPFSYIMTQQPNTPIWIVWTIISVSNVCIALIGYF